MWLIFPWPHVSLTYLQLSLDPSFASFPKGHLRLVVLGHDLHKLPGQHCVLRTSGSTRTEAENVGISDCSYSLISSFP